MTYVEGISFTFLAGVTVFGLLGSLLEILAHERLSFRPPFSSADHPTRSIFSPALAGPLMLMNDALSAKADKRISGVEFAACLLVSLLWTCAMGVAMLELAKYIAHG